MDDCVMVVYRYNGIVNVHELIMEVYKKRIGDLQSFYPGEYKIYTKKEFSFIKNKLHMLEWKTDGLYAPGVSKIKKVIPVTEVDQNPILKFSPLEKNINVEFEKPETKWCILS